MKRGMWLVSGLVLAALLFRALFWWIGYECLPLSSDEAWPGLMAMHILKGEFPVVYWGQSYMGTQESYVQALLILVFGPHKMTFRIYPLLIAVLFLWVTWRLTVAIYGPKAGLMALLLLAVPVPYLTLCSTAIPPDNYLATVTLGSWALLLAFQIIYRGRREPWRYGLLGFILGFGFWLHLLIVSYIGVVLLFLWLSDRLVFLRHRFWVCAAWFLAGAAPLLIFNLKNHWATFTDVGRTADWLKTFENASFLLAFTVRYLLGDRVMLYGDNEHTLELPALWQWGVVLVCLALLALLLIRYWKGLWRVFCLSTARTHGTVLLLAMAGAAFFVFSRSLRSSSHDVRYILPLMSVWPVLLAGGLRVLSRHSRVVAGGLLAFLVGTQVWGNVLLAKAWHDPLVVARDLELPDTRPLIRFLDLHGIRHAYAHYWVSYRLTCETKERIVCSEPYNERFPGRPVPFLDEVSAATTVALIGHPTLLPPDVIEGLLKRSQGSYEVAAVGDFKVFYHFVPPYGVTRLKEVAYIAPGQLEFRDPDGRVLDWAATSSILEGPSNAWAVVDAGSVRSLCQLRVEFVRPIVWPIGLKVEASGDGVNWDQVYCQEDVGDVLYWDKNQPRFLVRNRDFTVSFIPVMARYLRMTHLPALCLEAWSRASVSVCGPE